MSLVDELLSGNERFVRSGWDPKDAELDAPATKGLAIVACMDTRYNVEKVLGLEHGDAKVIRNAGNLLDDGTLRSLIVAIHRLEARHVVIMGHTKCGMTKVGKGEFRIAHHIAETTGIALHEVMRPDFQRWLGGFEDVEENVRRSLGLLRNHPYVPGYVDVSGLVYDNDTGRVHVVETLPGTRRGASGNGARPRVARPGTSSKKRA